MRRRMSKFAHATLLAFGLLATAMATCILWSITMDTSHFSKIHSRTVISVRVTGKFKFPLIRRIIVPTTINHPTSSLQGPLPRRAVAIFLLCRQRGCRVWALYIAEIAILHQ